MEENKDIEVQEGAQEREENLKEVPEGNEKGRRRKKDVLNCFTVAGELDLKPSVVDKNILLFQHDKDSAVSSSRIEFLRRRNQSSDTVHLIGE